MGVNMSSIMTVNEWGDKRWRNERGLLHREDGPAVECVNGSKEWYINGKRHREDGPAVVWADGGKDWCINGRLHREDGPAIEHADGTKEWYLFGEGYRTKQEYNQALKEKVRCEQE